MALQKVTQVAGTAIHIPGTDIDTDRIIPARFMKCVTFDGLGEYAFYDARRNPDGTHKAHPLNDARFNGANILLSGANFGCGSSREHAPQALYRYGFRAVLAESFAEIFFGNCTTLGIPCVVATAQDIQVLAAEVERNPKLEVTVDLIAMRVSFEDQDFPIVLPDTARDALTSGQWDPIAELLEHKDAVDQKIHELGVI